MICVSPDRPTDRPTGWLAEMRKDDTIRERSN